MTGAASARGAAARRRGNATETAVARWFAANGYPDARTTRAVLGHSGTRQPGDIAGTPGLRIEVKSGQRPAWAAWLRQTVEQADGLAVPVLVWRRPGISDPGRWLALVPGQWGPWWLTAGPCLTSEHELSRARYAAEYTGLEADPRCDVLHPVLHHRSPAGAVVTVTTLTHLVACRDALTRRVQP